MAERTGRRIQIANLQQSALETKRCVAEIKDLVEEKFLSTTYLRILGETLIGSRQLAVAGPDGVQLQDWSMDDINKAADRLQAQQENDIRIQLNEELIVATSRQNIHFSERRFRGKNIHFKKESQQVTDLVRDLLMEVLQSDEDLTYPWIDEMTEDRYAAEALEVIRRTLLRPTYILIEGRAEGPIASVPSYDEDDFWYSCDQRRDEILSGVEDPNNPANSDKVYRAQKQAALQNLTNYTPQEWRQILELEKRYLHEYLTARARRTFTQYTVTVSYAERLYDGRRRAFYARDINSFMKKNAFTGYAAYLLQGITDFDGIIPTFEQTFKRTLGYKFSFRDILGMVNPLFYDLGHIKPNPAVAQKSA